MSCELCGSGNTASFGMRTEHIYCHSCGGHKYEGQLIDRKAWDEWVNGKTKRPKRKPEKGRSDARRTNEPLPAHDR